MSADSDFQFTSSDAESDGTPMVNIPGSGRTVSWSPQEYAIKIRELLDEQQAELSRLTDALWEDHGWQYTDNPGRTFIDHVDPNTGEWYSIDVLQRARPLGGRALLSPRITTQPR